MVGSESYCLFYVVIEELLDGQVMEEFTFRMVEDILASFRDISFIGIDDCIDAEMILRCNLQVLHLLVLLHYRLD